VKYIDESGQGNTLVILTDKESRLIRDTLVECGQAVVIGAFNNGIARGTAKMAEESKAEWKARTKK
jgi:hypothetical protein